MQIKGGGERRVYWGILTRKGKEGLSEKRGGRNGGGKTDREGEGRRGEDDRRGGVRNKEEMVRGGEGRKQRGIVCTLPASFF